MAPAPANPKIFHITHVDNLTQIVSTGVLWSDAKRIELGFDCEVVGMLGIKARRLKELPVKCHPDTMVGEYVPFYFCPRSIMLYILHAANHPDITYRGGQGPIIHLVADLRAVVAWANTQKRPWAFSNCNAGARYADFYADLRSLDRINWDAVVATDFRDATVREGKQAEFLVFESFPWELVEQIGVMNSSIGNRVSAILRLAGHQPSVHIQPGWYY